MQSQKSLFVTGISLAIFPPLIGVILTIAGMVRGFEAVAGETGNDKAGKLAQHISTSLYSTVAGLAISLVGCALLLFGLYRHLRIKSLQKQLGELSAMETE